MSESKVKEITMTIPVDPRYPEDGDIILIIFDRIARIVLGFGSAQYIGKK